MWHRALRLAQSNLNDIADRATNLGRSRSLEDMSDVELEAELERRRKENVAHATVEEAKRRADHRREKSKGGDSGGVGSESPAALDLMDLSPKKRREVRQYYANLELPFGASFDDVKQSYRRLMRVYHPDKHQDDPARRQLATKLSQKLTKAYNELKLILRKQKP